MKFFLLVILIILFYFLNKHFIRERFSLLPEERHDSIVKKSFNSVNGKPVKIKDDDLSKLTLFPENKPGDIVPIDFFNIFLQTDKKIASINDDCVNGCEFTCLDDSDCLTNGNFNAVPKNNEKLKKEVVFNTLYEANFKNKNQKQKWSNIRNMVLLNNTNYDEDPKVERIIDHNKKHINKKYVKAKLDGNEVEAKIRQARFSKKFIGNEPKRFRRIRELRKKFKEQNREIKSRIQNNHFRDKLLKKICDKSDGFRFARLHKVLTDSYGDKWIDETEMANEIEQIEDKNKEMLNVDHWLPFLDLDKSRCIEYLKSVY